MNFQLKVSVLPVSSGIAGDCNGSNSFEIADAVMLQKWLLGSGGITEWQNADLCKDGKIDVFDMVEKRKLLIEKER